MATLTGKLQWSVVQRIRRWGWSRTLGLGLGTLAGVVYLAGQHYYASPLVDLQDRLAVMQKSLPPPVSDEPQVMALKDLPPVSKALISLADLQNLAIERGLSQESGQYKLEQDADLVRYRLNLPLTGTYPAVRMFLSQALARYPNLALDNVRISREEIGMSEVDAAIQLSLYFKP
jgi:hypothetical protein